MIIIEHSTIEEIDGVVVEWAADVELYNGIIVEWHS